MEDKAIINKAQVADAIKRAQGTRFVQFEVMQKTLELDKNIQEYSGKVTQIQWAFQQEQEGSLITDLTPH